MEYNDEALPSEKQLDLLEQGYNQSQIGYIFVRIDRQKEEALLDEVYFLLSTLKNNLFALGGFLGTGVFFNLNNKHIEKLQTIFAKDMLPCKQRFVSDKTKCFLNMISLESKLIEKLIELSLVSSHSEEIMALIKERTSLLGSLFQINGIISSFVR